MGEQGIINDVGNQLPSTRHHVQGLDGTESVTQNHHRRATRRSSEEGKMQEQSQHGVRNDVVKPTLDSRNTGKVI